jgi:hypothetical protein
VIGAIKIQDALTATLNIEIRFIPGDTGATEHQYRASDLTHQRAVVDQAEIYLKQLTEDVNR